MAFKSPSYLFMAAPALSICLPGCLLSWGETSFTPSGADPHEAPRHPLCSPPDRPRQGACWPLRGGVERRRAGAARTLAPAPLALKRPVPSAQGARTMPCPKGHSARIRDLTNSPDDRSGVRVLYCEECRQVFYVRVVPVPAADPSLLDATKTEGPSSLLAVLIALAGVIAFAALIHH
jgi:hypothetical protein